MGGDEDREVVETRSGRALWATTRTLVFTLRWKLLKDFKQRGDMIQTRG